MKVHACPSCGARYNVERLETGATFACRRCGSDVTIGESTGDPGRFSWALLLSGLFAVGVLFLFANPDFGFGFDVWPWELVRGDTDLPTKFLVLTWFVTGAWALLAALGIAPQTRSLSTLGLTGVLILVCAAAKNAPVDGGDLAVTTTTWLQLIGMIGVAAGLTTHTHSPESPAARALALGGGLVLLGTFLLVFGESGTNALREMVATVRAWIDGQPPTDPWHVVVGRWALLVAGVTGMVVGFGLTSRAFTWIGVVSLLVFLLLPTLTAVVGEFGEERFWKEWRDNAASYGQEALVANGLVLWWLGTAAAADLVRAGRDDR